MINTITVDIILSPPPFLADFGCRSRYHTKSPPPFLAKNFLDQIRKKNKNLNKSDITLSPPPFLGENF